MSMTEQTQDNPSIFRGYLPKKDVFDEAFFPSGEKRPHWLPFIQEFGKIHPDDRLRRLEIARQVIRANGVSFNLYGSPNGVGREWQLDPIPLIIPPEEWEWLEKSLIQRARLLNMILADCYGQQRMIRQGVLPPALVFSHPGFLRPCHGIPIPQNQYLTFYSVDVARSPDGRWWVVSDRAQAPSGAGYALENRAAISRMIPDIYMNCGVRSLGNFFSTMRDALVRLAPRNKENPRIALLTPGPYNEIYFEHAYLARQMGFFLAQGEDLTVRDNQVFLKTVNGLMVVDVIMRRVDDDFCDPLELRSDSFLGVPGLVNAIRCGNVAVANMLGSGVIQNPALMPFLPGLCQHLLGEDLLMPCVATWWCGQRKAFDEVFDKLDHLVIRSTMESSVTISGLPVGTYSKQEREELLHRVAAQPYAYIGQEQVSLSTAPVLNQSKVEPRSVMLRLHLVSNGESYVVMPGGLTRTSSSSENTSVSMQRGAASKDTWVLTTSTQHASVPVQITPVSILRRGGNDLPSRLADNLFWLGRYMERVEVNARLIRTLLNRLMQESSLTTEEDLQPFLTYLRRAVPSLGEAKFSDGEVDRYLMGAIFDSNVQGGIKNTIGQVSNIMRMVRESFSSAACRIVMDMESHILAPRLSNRAQMGEALVTLETLLTLLFSFSGMQYENMSRNQGWRFFDIGRRMERGMFCLELVRDILWSPCMKNPFTLDALLEMNDNLMAYRTRYFTAPRLPSVLDMMVVDESNPRSAAFQVVSLEEHVRHLVKSSSQTSSEELELVQGIVNKFRSLNMESLNQVDDGDALVQTRNCIHAQDMELYRLSNVITVNYFSHTQLTYRADQMLA